MDKSGVGDTVLIGTTVITFFTLMVALISSTNPDWYASIMALWQALGGL